MPCNTTQEKQWGDKEREAKKGIKRQRLWGGTGVWKGVMERQLRPYSVLFNKKLLFDYIMGALA